MRESAESRSAAVRAVLLRFYPHQYAWGESCAVTVSLLLRFTEAAHDSAVMNPISNRTIVCRRRESPARPPTDTGTQYRDASSIIKYCNTVYRYIRYTGTDDLRITDLIIRIDHACVNRQNPGRPRCARCCCDFTRTSMPGASHVHLL